MNDCQPLSSPKRRHFSSRQRRLAYMLAIPIPCAIWACNSFIICNRLFGLSVGVSAAVAGMCTALVCLLELLMMLSPPKWYVSTCRVFIAVLVSVLGASGLDMCIFAKEIEFQLREDWISKRNQSENDIAAKHAVDISNSDALVKELKSDWDNAQAEVTREIGGGLTGKPGCAAACKQLKEESNLRYLEYKKAVNHGDQLVAKRDAEVKALVVAEPSDGILDRLQALHKYTAQNSYAQAAWLALFLLVMGLEMCVVLVKAAFGTTMEDHLAQLKAQSILGPVERAVHARNTQAGRDWATLQLSA